MKKFLVIFVLIAAVFSFAACGENDIGDTTGSGGEIVVNPDENPGDEPIEGGITETLLLIATYTNNARLTSPSATSTVSNENELAFVKIGKTASEAGRQSSVIYYKYEGDTSQLDSLVGQAVKITRVGETVKRAKPMKYVVQGYASDFVKNGILYYCKDTQIKVNLSLMEKEKEKRAWAQDISGIWREYTNGDFVFGNACDEIYTMCDTDEDGKLDFLSVQQITNGLKIDIDNCVEGKKAVFTSCGYGSLIYSGWFNSQALPYKLCGGLEGKKLSDIKDMYLNVRVVRNNKTGGVIVGDITAMYEIYPAETVTGTFEKFLPETYSQFSPNNNFIYVDGEKYLWADAISSNTNCDGPAGVFAGRQPQAGSIGGQITLVFDLAGNVVYAKGDTMNEEITFTTFETENGTEAAAVIDVQAAWHGAVTTYEAMKKRVSLLYSMGIRRVYVVTCNPGFPQFSNNYCGYSSRSAFKGTVNKFMELGFESPDHALPEICHSMGMECVAIYKVYEGGGMENIPYGCKYDPEFTAFDGFGGLTVQLDSFLTENLQKGIDYRIVRRPDGANDNLEGTVDRITVDFISGEFEQRTQTSRRDDMRIQKAVSADLVKTIANGKTYTNKNRHPSHAVNIWVSPDNYHYSLYTGDYSYTYKTGRKLLYDANGDLLYGKLTDVITLEVTNLKIDEKFVAVTFDSTNGLRTDPLSFMHIYSGDREIYTSTTDFVRRADFDHDNNPDDYEWGRSSTPVGYGSCAGIKVVNGVPVATASNLNNETTVTRAAIIQRFNLYGFAFNFEPYAGFVRGDVGVIAAGRGAEETFPGGYCEAYPEVRQFWLSHVKTLLEAGFDGIAIRLQSHSSIATDFKNYGYNEPIVERYKEIYGKAAYDTLMDPNHHVTDEEYINLMKIRGNFFMLFAKEASKLCHEYEKDFSVMLREAYCDPQVSSRQNEVTWWTMPKVVLDWKAVVDLSDNVIIKDYIHYEKDVSVNAKEIRQYAKAQGKKVSIMCYDSQAGMFTDAFFANAVSDAAIDEIMLYELSSPENYVNKNFGKQLEKWGFKVTEKD